MRVNPVTYVMRKTIKNTNRIYGYTRINLKTEGIIP